MTSPTHNRTHTHVYTYVANDEELTTALRGDAVVPRGSGARTVCEFL